MRDGRKGRWCKEKAKKMKTLKEKVRRFRVLPGAEITMGFDYTGQVLEQFGEGWLEDTRTGHFVLKQPEKDANGKVCAVGGSVSIDASHLVEEISNG